MFDGAWSGGSVEVRRRVVGFATHPGGPLAAAHRPISAIRGRAVRGEPPGSTPRAVSPSGLWSRGRSEEHTSELQSRGHLVCRLLLEKNNRSIDKYSPF